MQNTIKILVDLKKEIYRFDQAQQGDDVILDLTILENGVAKDLTGETVELIYINANNTIASVTGDKIVVNGNNVKITCPTDCTRSYGIAKFQLKIVSTYQVSTFPIALTIVPSVDQNQQISQNISTILEDLTAKNIECGETLDSLKAWISTGNLLNADLEGNIGTGTLLNTDLEDNITTVTQLKTVLTNVINTGNELDTSLEEKIGVGNTLDATLKADTEIANTAATNLENVIETADLTTYASQGQMQEVNSQLADIVYTKDIKTRTSKIIGHRGASAYAPENTLPSIEKASELGFFGVECDVEITKDGYFVISHDDTVDRMTNGTGLISSLTLAEIKALTIDSGNNISNYPNLTIPTLEEWVAHCKKYGLVCVVHTGKFGGRTDEFLTILRKYDMESSTMLLTNIDLANELRPKTNLVSIFLIYFEGISNVLIDTCKNNGYGLSYESNKMTLDQSYFDTVKYAHSKGVLLNAWTENTQSRVNDIASYGVQYITTDSVNQLSIIPTPIIPKTKLRCMLKSDDGTLPERFFKYSSFGDMASVTKFDNNTIKVTFVDSLSERGIALVGKDLSSNKYIPITSYSGVNYVNIKFMDSTTGADVLLSDLPTSMFINLVLV